MTVKYQELFYLLQKFLCFIVISQVKMNPFIISFIITAWSGQLATFLSYYTLNTWNLVLVLESNVFLFFLIHIYLHTFHEGVGHITL